MKQLQDKTAHPREYHGQYTGHGFPILEELNPSILVRNVERMQYHQKLLIPQKYIFFSLIFHRPNG